MNDPDSTAADFAETIAIVGVGLIGGSIAAALKKRNFPGRLIGVGRNPARLAGAQNAGLIDDYTDEISTTEADFWVFCTPVDGIASGVAQVVAIPNKTVLVTDAGSVKGPICESLQGRLPRGVEFIGSHPLAGSERRGFEHAEADLFEDRVCVLTPDEATSGEQLARLSAFWKYLGMRVIEMPAGEHDQALAETSHLPHLVAAALAAMLDEKNRHLTATGFADTTRIAAGDPEIWTAIFLQNAEAVLSSLSAFSDQLARFRNALQQQDAAAIHDLLKQAKSRRDKLEPGQH